jgi:hypothetical protein
VGILQLMELGVECGEGEVWWEFRRRHRAKERARKLLPAEKALWVFTDLTSQKAGPSGGGWATRETNRLTSRSSRGRDGRG